MFGVGMKTGWSHPRAVRGLRPAQFEFHRLSPTSATSVPRLRLHLFVGRVEIVTGCARPPSGRRKLAATTRTRLRMRARKPETWSPLEYGAPRRQRWACRRNASSRGNGSRSRCRGEGRDARRGRRSLQRTGFPRSWRRRRARETEKPSRSLLEGLDDAGWRPDGRVQLPRASAPARSKGSAIPHEPRALPT